MPMVRYLVLATLFFQHIASGEADILIGVGVLRAKALHVVMPEYPQRSVQAGHVGTAVAEVDVSREGKVTQVHILQAPDEAISRSVDKALRHWTFGPTSLDAPGKPLVEVKSRLLFSFRIEMGKGVVQDLAAELLRREGAIPNK